MVRNLDYRTDACDDDKGRNPRFHTTSKSGVTVPVSLPEWLRYGEVSDFLTGDPVPADRGDLGVEVKISVLGAYKLLWIGNATGAIQTGESTSMGRSPERGRWE